MTFSTLIHQNNPTYESKEEGIQAAYDGKSAEWKDAALTIVYNLALERAVLSADDVVMCMEAYPELERSYNGLPNLFKIAKKNGWIKEALCSCGEEVKTCESQRTVNHGRRIMVYKSLLC